MSQPYTRGMRAKKRLSKCVIYFLMILISFLLLSDPNVSFWGLKPNLLIPLCTMIAVWEGEFTGALVGAGCGLLMDMALRSLLGFHGILMMVLMFFCGFGVKYLLRPHFLNCFLLTAISALTDMLLDYGVYYQLFDYPYAGEFFLRSYLPQYLLTLLFVPVFFFPVRWVARRFRFSD